MTDLEKKRIEEVFNLKYMNYVNCSKNAFFARERDSNMSFCNAILFTLNTLGYKMEVNSKDNWYKIVEK